jgi:protoporphyrinogen/coproporphyrinogen III oxidase
MTHPRHVLVVGGGITGLTAAWEAARSGAAVTLVEASGRIGGKVRTEVVDGLLVEHGPDSFVAHRPAALELIAALGLADDVIGVRPGRTVHVRVDGRLLPLPDGMGMVLPTRLGPLARTPLLTWRHKARAGLDLVLPRRLGPADTSIGWLLRARLGEGVVQRFAQPLVGGIYGAGVDQLSLDAVLPTLRSAEARHRSLIVASLVQGRATRRAAAAAPGGTAGGSPFRSLRGGMGSLVERLAEELATLGVDLRVGTTVTGLERVGGTTTATLSDGTGVSADAVVLAIGAPAMAGLLAAHAPAAADALAGIAQGSSTLVTLAYDLAALPRPPQGQGWLEAGAAPISGVTISSAKWAGRAPQDVVLLRAFVPGRLGPLSEAPDAQLVPSVVEHVGRVLGATAGPHRSWVTRWPRVMPVYAVGHLARVAAVDAALAELPGWQVAGSALHGVGIPECIADGRRAGRVAATADPVTPVGSPAAQL